MAAKIGKPNTRLVTILSILSLTVSRCCPAGRPAALASAAART